MTPAAATRAGRGPFVVAGVALVAGLLWMLWPMPAVDPVVPEGARAHAAAEPAEAAGSSAAEQREQVAAEKAPGAAGAPTEPRWPVRFLVVDDSGAPIENCDVSAAEASTRTGRDGRATLELPAGYCTLAFGTVDGRYVTERGHIEVREGLPELQIVLTRAADIAFHGVVVDGISGAAVPGAEVWLCERDRRLATVMSAADGSFEVRAAGERTWLEVHAAGHGLRLVQIEAGHEVREAAMPVPLPPQCRLRLRVTDAAGRPLAAINVGISAQSSDLLLPAGSHLPRAPERWQATTDARGEAAIEPPLPAAIPLTLELVRGREIVHRRSVRLGAGEQELVVALGGATVSGRVVRSDGGPLAGIRVGLAPWTEPPPAFMVRSDGLQTAVCTADGAFGFAELDAGPWVLGVLEPANGNAPLVPVCTLVHVERGGQHQIDLHVPAAGVITGRCLLPDGSAAADVALELLDEGRRWATGAVSDARGGFSIGPLPPGSWLLAVDVFRDQFGLPSPLRVQTGDRDLELRLVPTMGRITGRVIDSAGRPSRAWVMMSRRDHGDALAMHTALDGTFGFEGLRPGSWDVTANDAGSRAALAAGLQVQPGRDAGPVTLTLQPGGSLVIRGRGDLLIRSGDATLLRDNMPAGGSYRIRVPPGDYSVTLTPAGGAPQTFTATVTAGGEAHVGG